MLVGESRGHLLVGMRQVGLRHGGRWLRSWGCRRVRGWHLDLRRPRHGAWHHLGVLLGYVALWGLVALGYLRLGLEAVLLMWLQLTRESLLELGRNAGLGGHISMWVGLRVRSRNGSWSRLVPLRERLSNGLGWVLLRVLLLLCLGYLSLPWALNGNSWLGYKLRVSPHLWW